MSVRKRVLKPDQMGRYRPYLGYRIDGKQPRFNLGTDKLEAERRFNRLFELWAENVVAAGEETWSPLALSFALQVADGKRRIEYPLSSQILDAEDPAAEYAQVIHVERERFPSLDIVAAGPEIYSAGLRRTRISWEVRLRNFSRDYRGSLHGALDAYSRFCETHTIEPTLEGPALSQYGAHKLANVTMLKRHLPEPVASVD